MKNKRHFMKVMLFLGAVVVSKSIAMEGDNRGNGITGDDTLHHHHPHFIFVRHGQSLWDPTMLHLGPQDLPLTVLGRSQAEACAQVLKSLLGLQINKIFASSLLRTQETAGIIGSALDLPICFIDGLKERYFGDFRLLEQSDQKLSIPPDAETDEVFLERVISAFSKINQESLGHYFMIVSHEKVFECLAQYLCNATDKIEMGQAKIFHFHKDVWKLHEIE